MTTPKRFGELLRRSRRDWNDDNAQRLGAALAFYAFLSISPLVIVAVAVVSRVFSRSQAQRNSSIRYRAWSVRRDAMLSKLF